MKKLFLFTPSRTQVGGFSVFTFSLTLYLLTLSPTVNLWDCGEFIACANGLEVGHAPGAPLYLMLARMFSIFASPNQIALCINVFSALASAATIWLLYSTILLILNKIDENKIGEHSIASAMVGSLTFAFTDTFWFSAVEGEVYALSLFFTAFTVWAVFKWETKLPHKNAHQWLILIAFTMGLSVGVHLLNLLCIPVVVYWVFIKLQPAVKHKHIYGLLLGFSILVFIQFVFIQNGLFFAKNIELILVNKLHLPVHSGLILFVVILMSFLITGIILFRNRNQFVHFSFLATLIFVIGISSYAMVIIRANAQPGINLNNPNHVFSLESFINREQYGERPLIMGAWFGAEREDIKPVFNYRLNKNGEYSLHEQGNKLVYNANDIDFLQRMHSSQQHHKKGYYFWSGLENGEKPTLMHQLEYMFKYQFGHMYFRYFMWNFSGRQNHYQGHGDFLHGNFITGLPFLDKQFLGNRDYVHTKELTSKARNQYFLLPLLFGIIGILMLIKRKKWNLLIFLGSLFLLTGIAIAFYLNQPPFEPRERDYVFVGSFYTFSIFIALGAWVFLETIQQLSPSKFTNLIAIAALFLALPILLIANNFNDHDRSDRNLARDMAISCLNSCDQNAILFTYGDNDTYPLWYLQEVEGVRRDVHVVNIGLLSADWYVEQQSIKQKGKDPLLFSIPLNRYKKGDLDYAAIINKTSEAVAIKKCLTFIGDTTFNTQLQTKGVGVIDYLPSHTLQLGTDTSLYLKINKNYLMKGEIALLDIIGTNHPERPIYFANGTPKSAMLGFDKFSNAYGVLSKISWGTQEPNTAELLQLFNDKINIPVPEKSWWDESCLNLIHLSKLESATLSLSERLMAQGDTVSAQVILGKFYPISILPYYNLSDKDLTWIKTLFKANLQKEARVCLENNVYASIQNFNFYVSSQEILGSNMLAYANEEMQHLKECRAIANRFGMTTIVSIIDSSIN